MGQTQSAPPAEALRFRYMARAVYFGQLKELRVHFDVSLVALQISRATYLDICMQEQSQLDAVADSLARERREAQLQDEKMEFFSAVERGRIVLGDTILHIAVRLGHEAIVDFLLLTDHGAKRPGTSGPISPSTHGNRGGLSKSMSSGLNSTQTPNFKGERPYDVAATSVLRLVLDNVADVHEVFGVTYADEPKVHRLTRALQRVWPLWMVEGQQEAANLVRVLYDVSASDAAFGKLVKVTLAAAERFRTAISRSGVAIAAKLLVASSGHLSTAKDTALTEWDAEHKRALLFAIFRDSFCEWKHRRDSDRDQAYVDFFDSAMDAWLTIAHDLKLHETPRPLETLDVATLRRYDLHVWKRRLRPPPAVLEELCMHISALEKYLHLTHLKP